MIAYIKKIFFAHGPCNESSPNDILVLSELTYYLRLKTLNLESLELRRMRADLILVSKNSLRFIGHDE